MECSNRNNDGLETTRLKMSANRDNKTNERFSYTQPFEGKHAGTTNN